ncbi:hypothetical protein PIB30_100759, partial [Stylosanthes scabra]|nr:hypothetical protein [Stylosanthes scabra]
DFMVVTLYPNGEMGRDTTGIWFRSTTPLVFQMQPVNTLEELNSVILHNMGVGGDTMLVRRVADHLLNIFPPNQLKFKILWVEGEEHVCTMFDLHRRYRTREVMELLTKIQTVDADVGGSSSSDGGAVGVITCSPIHFAAPEVSWNWIVMRNPMRISSVMGRIVAKARMVQSLCRSPRRDGTLSPSTRPNS